MSRKLEDERERQQNVRAAKEAGKKPSEVGATQGADKQRSKERRGGHPEQKTTHPVR